ncbi:hypothetical protein XENTR_v10022644 [Xenopus tropicalis]|nr:hypothetical protein XENTR_v10022644 [Xenopus tropicalis]
MDPLTLFHTCISYHGREKPKRSGFRHTNSMVCVFAPISAPCAIPGAMTVSALVGNERLFRANKKKPVEVTEQQTRSDCYLG